MVESYGSADEWIDRLQEILGDPSASRLETARLAVAAHPENVWILHLAACAALLEEKPDACLLYTRRLMKRYTFHPAFVAFEAIARAQKGQWPIAQSILQSALFSSRQIPSFFPTAADRQWVARWLRRIEAWRAEAPAAHHREPAPPRAAERPVPARAEPEAQPGLPLLPPLPRAEAHIPLRIDLPDPACFAAVESGGAGVEDFLVRLDLARISLLEGFDELVCLPHLRGVDHYWYQEETAKKVLRQFRGRVLLADEVGLGKTIEAGLALKEYLLRGMARTALVLAPPALVGQWQEEMESKFGIDFATTNEPLLARDPAAFWRQPRIIASIATARRGTHAEELLGREFDIVIVDEAHHLRSRSSRNWQLVDGLKKRFLLLLSATPVQNNLVELYNLLTLLKPGIFKTEKEFRTAYVTRGNPRLPANRERLHGLMRDVMIRNTRALVDVRLPARHAHTERVALPEAESACYRDLGALVRALPADWLSTHRLALHHLLEAAGSSGRAAAAVLRRFVQADPPGAWRELLARYERLGAGGKAAALETLLARNPAEKKIVFVRFRETLGLLEELLAASGTPCAVFEGSLTGPEKDSAIDAFRGKVPVLLTTESGGEGRNLQFCNTLVNFDLPWNPQLIEQRIGRIHRIGQTREVFVFNLAARGTIEERLLSILDEKINMFELVVGEIQSILGELEEDPGFAQMVFAAWLAQTEEDRERAFEDLGEKLAAARTGYEDAKRLDTEVFGEEFEVV